MIEDITIAQLTRKQLPSKHKPGETYNLVNIVDAQNRQLSSFGAWADGWKVGDVVKGIVEPKEWTDRNGNKQTNLNIKNPDAKSFSKGGFAPAPSTRQFQAYSIAAALIPYMLAGKKVTIADVDKLAVIIKKRIEFVPPTTAQPVATPPVVPTVTVDTPTPAPATPAPTTLAPATPATPPAKEEATETTFDFDEGDPFGEKQSEF